MSKGQPEDIELDPWVGSSKNTRTIPEASSRHATGDSDPEDAFPENSLLPTFEREDPSAWSRAASGVCSSLLTLSGSLATVGTALTTAAFRYCTDASWPVSIMAGCVMGGTLYGVGRARERDVLQNRQREAKLGYSSEPSSIRSSRGGG